ncbi:MAG: hypothetical protein ACJ0KD_05575 [Dehalococcoidia bacterium]
MLQPFLLIRYFLIFFSIFSVMLLSFYAIQDAHAAEAGNSSQFELIYEDMFFNIDVQSSNKNFSSFDAVSFSKNDTEWHFPDGDTFEFIPINRAKKNNSQTTDR